MSDEYLNDGLLLNTDLDLDMLDVLGTTNSITSATVPTISFESEDELEKQPLELPSDMKDEESVITSNNEVDFEESDLSDGEITVEDASDNHVDEEENAASDDVSTDENADSGYDEEFVESEDDSLDDENVEQADDLDSEEDDDDDYRDGFYRRKKVDESDSNKRELHPMKLRKSTFLILAARVATAMVLLILSLALSKNEVASLLLLLGSFLAIGADLFYKAIIEALEGNIFNNNLLLAVAAIGSFCIGRNAEGVVVLIFYQVGQMLINIALSNSHKTITKLLDLRPSIAHIIRDDVEADCPVSEVLPGDLFIVHPGERLPVDGFVVSGKGNIDASQISGENMILSAGPGDALCSGSVNIENDIILRAATSYSDSTVAKILNVVDNAEEKKGESERFISKFSKIYTPCAFGAALIIGLIVPLISGLDLSIWVQRGINILVIACPGALMVSVPLSYFAGIGRAAIRGILFKGADVVDTMSKTSTVVFDKNSTVSAGKLGISSINPISGVSQSEVLTLAAYAMINSGSASARCLLDAAGPVVNRSNVTRYHEEKGKGVVCQLGENMLVIAGSREFLSLFKINCPYEYRGQEVVYVCRGKEYIGSICMDNTAIQNTAAAIRDIHRNDVDRVIMLSDESPERTKEAANAIGITEFFSVSGEEEREERMRYLLDMSLEGDKLVYVGDDDSDAPLLTIADIGVTVRGIGTEEAVNSSDVIILSDDTAKIPLAINISKGVQRVITANMIVALGIKTAIMLLSLPGLMLMWLAELIDICVSIFTIMNAMRAFDPDRFGFKTIPELLNPMTDGTLPAVKVRKPRVRNPLSPRAQKDAQKQNDVL